MAFHHESYLWSYSWAGNIRGNEYLEYLCVTHSRSSPPENLFWMKPCIPSQESTLQRKGINIRYRQCSEQLSTRTKTTCTCIYNAPPKRWWPTATCISMLQCFFSFHQDQGSCYVQDLCHVPPWNLLVCMRDCTSKNNVTVRFLEGMFTNMLEAGCLLHILDLTGDWFGPLISQNSCHHSWVCLVIVRKQKSSGRNKQIGRSKAIVQVTGGPSGSASNRCRSFGWCSEIHSVQWWACNCHSFEAPSFFSDPQKKALLRAELRGCDGWLCSVVC